MDWTGVTGGQTNRVWRVRTPDATLFVKLYVPAMSSRLFPNRPGTEVRALTRLSTSGLAPTLVAAGRTAAGRVLCLDAAPGEPPVHGDRPLAAQGVAFALARLHGWAVDAGFRQVSVRPRALAEGVRADLADLPDTRGAARLRDLARRWSGRSAPDAPAVVLHGDPVAGNTLLDDAGRVTLVDWQCPARGDPVHDLALSLSPGMRVLYGATPWTPTARAAFWDAYGDPGAQARHAALAPLLAARIAAHFLAQAARGRPGYATAAEVELAALEE